jgi:hypothetical protein
LPLPVQPQPLSLLLPLQVLAVILSAAKNPEELNLPHRIAPFYRDSSSPICRNEGFLISSFKFYPSDQNGVIVNLPGRPSFFVVSSRGAGR